MLLPRITGCKLFDAVIFLIPAIVALVLLFPELSSADGSTDVNRALDRLNKAHNDYYRELVRLGPNPSADQIKDLEMKTTLPARVDWISSIRAVEQKVEKDTRKAIYDSMKKAVGEALIPSWLLDPSKKPKQTNTARNAPPPAVKSAGTSGLKVIDSGPSRPVLILDGSKIPKEIEFKSGGEGSPSPADLPLIEPEVSGEGHTDVIEFQKK